MHLTPAHLFITKLITSHMLVQLQSTPSPLVWHVSHMCCVASSHSDIGFVCRFAFGGRGIYFGGKDVMVSEISGNFAVSAETVSAEKPGALPTARITFQICGVAPAAPYRCVALRHVVALPDPDCKTAYTTLFPLVLRQASCLMHTSSWHTTTSNSMHTTAKMTTVTAFKHSL